MNIIYDENYDRPCLIHKISKIRIFYNINNLEIIYNFDIVEFERVKQLLIIDISNGIFIDKLIINNFKIFDSKITDLDYAIQSLIKTDVLDSNNSIKLLFDVTAKNIKNSIDEYIWFTYLVRYETFEYEEDEFFFNETIKKREMCIDRETLLNDLKSIFY